MNFRTAEKYLLSLGNEVEAMKLGLENIRTLLAEIGKPQKQYLKVQIAGTNGKGSVCAFLGAMTRAAGIRTGVFTSPHLVSMTERIDIGGENISEDEFARVAGEVREAAESLLERKAVGYRPTYFEQVTAIALKYFAEQKIELAILETGMGGRFDATTAANAEIAVITAIGLDHQQYLGETIEQIAGEKAAIIGPQTTAAITQPQRPESVFSIIAKRAEMEDVPLIVAGPLEDETEVGLAGRHQRQNGALAAAAARELRRYFPISEDQIGKGLRDARHPGRLETVGGILLDGAHNADGAKALARHLSEHFAGQRTALVFGAMRDKDVREMAEILFPLAETVIWTQPANSRSLAFGDLPKEVAVRFRDKLIDISDSVAAIRKAREIAGDGGAAVVGGSLYLVGEARSALMQGGV